MNTLRSAWITSGPAGLCPISEILFMLVSRVRRGAGEQAMHCYKDPSTSNHWTGDDSSFGEISEIPEDSDGNKNVYYHGHGCCCSRSLTNTCLVRSATDHLHSSALLSTFVSLSTSNRACRTQVT